MGAVTGAFVGGLPGDRDVRVAGGGATIPEYVNARLIDELTIALSPVLGDPPDLRGPEEVTGASGPPGAGPLAA